MTLHTGPASRPRIGRAAIRTRKVPSLTSYWTAWCVGVASAVGSRCAIAAQESSRLLKPLRLFRHPRFFALFSPLSPQRILDSSAAGDGGGIAVLPTRRFADTRGARLTVVNSSLEGNDAEGSGAAAYGAGCLLEPQALACRRKAGPRLADSASPTYSLHESSPLPVESQCKIRRR